MLKPEKSSKKTLEGEQLSIITPTNDKALANSRRVMGRDSGGYG